MTRRFSLLPFLLLALIACGPEPGPNDDLTDEAQDAAAPAYPLPQATISNVAPARVRVGDLVLISGQGFSTYPQLIVELDGAPMPLVSRTDTSIRVRVPFGARPGRVVIRDANLWPTVPGGCELKDIKPTCAPKDPDCDPRAEGASCTLQCAGITASLQCTTGLYSNMPVASAQIIQVPVRTTIQNRTRFPLRSLVLNGVEQIPANQVLPHGNDWVIEDFPTTIRVQATSVYFDPLEGRYLDHHVIDWTMSSPFNLTLAPPPLTEQLSRFAQFAGTRLGSNWQITVSFRFYANGQFEYFEDEQRLITGRYAETGAQATTRYGILQYNLNGVPTSASFEFEETRGLLTLTINNERVTLVGR
jgi:hypothetical protein